MKDYSHYTTQLSVHHKELADALRRCNWEECIRLIGLMQSELDAIRNCSWRNAVDEN